MREIPGAGHRATVRLERSGADAFVRSQAGGAYLFH